VLTGNVDEFENVDEGVGHVEEEDELEDEELVLDGSAAAAVICESTSEVRVGLVPGRWFRLASRCPRINATVSAFGLGSSTQRCPLLFACNQTQIFLDPEHTYRSPIQADLILLQRSHPRLQRPPIPIVFCHVLDKPFDPIRPGHIFFFVQPDVLLRNGH
jgi:hypothetical protein